MRAAISAAVATPLNRTIDIKQYRHIYLAPVVIGILGCALLNPELFRLLRDTISDAYLGVSIFVAITLAGFYLIKRSLVNRSMLKVFQNQHLQVPCAAFLGALPGCGGAIIVTTQYVNGRMSFGALIAVLISTMGDAAFILLAQKPKIALLIYGISLLSGALFGHLIDRLHGTDFLRPKRTTEAQHATQEPLEAPSKGVQVLFLLLLLPGTLLGLLGAAQIDSSGILGGNGGPELQAWLGFTGGMLCLYIYLTQSRHYWSALFRRRQPRSIQESTIAETSLISVWVMAGFLSYELFIFFSGLDLSQYFFELGAGAVLLAILVGFIPGCGPQILLTTLYLNGIVPLSAQLANAISNDGDALFPAMALAPKAAIIATLYSAIPAVIIGFSAHSLGY